MENYLCNTTANSIYSLQAYEEPKEKKLIHYTSMEVMDILLDKCTFRASNVFYLNDAMEYKEGIDRLKAIASNNGKAVLEQIKDENGSGKINRGIFSISFSQETDSLYQWITYAKETGVAIELDDDLIMDYEPLWYGIESYDESTDKDSNYEELLFITLRVAMYPVIYEYENTTQIDEMSADTKEKYMWYASFYKTKGFKAENEVRLSVFATENDHKKFGKIKYFPMKDKGILRPYLDITFGHGVGEYPKTKFKPCLPVKSIMIGPSKIQQNAFDSVIHRVKYGKTNVYEYARSRKDLIKAFANYFKELSEWLTVKGYTNNKNNNKTSTKAATVAMGNSLTDDIINQNDIVVLAGKQLTDRLGKPASCELLIKKIISDWIAEHKEYLSGMKDESGIELYDESYLGKSDDTTEPQLDTILQEIKNDLYFSKEGVLIKKSKIPYIF